MQQIRVPMSSLGNIMDQAMAGKWMELVKQYGLLNQPDPSASQK
jgi:hypothetical protein